MSGNALAITKVALVEDKGKAAIARLATRLTTPDQSGTLCTTTAAIYIRGAGGWGGPRAPVYGIGMPPFVSGLGWSS